VGRLSRSLSSQIFLYQLLILTATLLVGFGLALKAAQGRLDDEYEQRALAVARSVAATPEVARALEQGDRSGVVQARAERVRRATGTSFVVVADVNGIRYSHPNRANIGKRVSTPPDALSGRTVLAVEKGTLGRSARAKVPLRAADGRIVGQVSVGVLEHSVRDQLGTIIPVIALYTGIALLAGLGASLLLARRLKRQTFGLELGELAELLQEREAMLHGVREGVVAVDPQGRIRVVNAQARRLLDLPGDVVGRRPAEALGPGRLADALEGRLEGGDDLLLVHGERVLVANRMPVTHQERDLGAVITLRDRTELEGLVRELGSVRDLTDAMRAQAHEFSNRMHTVSGLLELGHYDEAVGFVKATTAADTEFRRSLEQRVADPVIAALLLAKAAVSAERGVTLRLTEDTAIAAELTDARAVLTVLGNLIDNAIDAARLGGDDQPWVEVDLRLDRAAALLIRVADTGPGVPPDVRELVFEPGWTTKPAGGLAARGVGLALVRRLAERRGGAISVSDDPRGGAVFAVRLPVRLLADVRREPEKVGP
jgi:two-component system CitB family sensor kinase